MVAYRSARQRSLQRREIDGLHQVSIEAGFARSLPVFRLAITRERDETHVRAAGEGTQAPCELISVDVWQADVQQHDVGLEHRIAFERGARCVYRNHLVLV